MTTKFLKRAWDYFSKPKLRISHQVIPFGIAVERKEPYGFSWSLLRHFSSRREAEKFIGKIKPDQDLNEAEFF